MRGRAAGMLDHRPGRILEQLLAQEADARAARVCDRAGVRRVEPRRDAQQGRLSGPVRAHETDAVAVADAERHVLQDLTRAEPARDRLDREHAHVTILRRFARVTGAFWQRGQ